ncbi:major facilitator superfamily domain-containing protein [Cristinia sonorae]|uniref:Major facilitator superfamily domain-containing protein n=1 Tax=Cristinia sonorae TaxID=1940300 RepID=A0A8K0USN3_9AGAR|nr:major facilitator superfamily domain-containing protein [Cristinia sonorae]
MPSLKMNQSVKDALITITICGVTVLSIFLTGATAVAITTIGKDLHFKQTELEWPINIYTLSYGCLLLLLGRIADIIGSKKMFLIGSAWFSLWSVAAALAPNAWTFILFFAFQGIGSAANTPAGIAMISSYFPPGKAKNRAFSILGAGQPIGYIVGLILGGILAQSSISWRAIYGLQAGFGLVFCVLGWMVLPEDQAEKRYSKGLDWVGALLSTGGLGLLVYDLGESITAPKGWATPFIPSLLGTSFLILGAFVWWELRREAKGQSVLLPMSMFTAPGTRIAPVILVVLFGWWGFNTISYFLSLYLQQVVLASPLQTALRLIPLGVSGLLTNLVTGYLIAVVPGQILVLIGLASCLASAIVFALINVNASYWAMTFIVTITVPVLDIAYTVGNMQVCLSFDGNSQALAGSMFGVATRLGTSLGLAVSSSVANSVSQKFNLMPEHASLSATDPQVLVVGFRAAGWVCVGALGLAVVIAVFGLRGIGLVGQQAKEDKRTTALELGTVASGDEGNVSVNTESAQFPHSPASDSQTQVDIPAPEKDGKLEFGMQEKAN